MHCRGAPNALLYESGPSARLELKLPERIRSEGTHTILKSAFTIVKEVTRTLAIGLKYRAFPTRSVPVLLDLFVNNACIRNRRHLDMLHLDTVL